MIIANVSAGVLASPMRILIYGEEGLGKSTFAAKAPKPIWIGAERGTGHLDVARFPEPTTFDEVLEATRTLEHERHDFETLVLDPMGFLEPLVWRQVCEARKWPDIESPGFGKGYAAANEEWRLLIAQLERLYARGMHIILVAHADKKSETHPDIEDFERYVLALNQRASLLFRRWCDYTLFARQKVWTKRGEDKRVRGVTDGARVIHTQPMPAYFAKSRPALPATLPLSWKAFMDAREAASPARAKERAAELRGQIEGLLETLGREEAANDTRTWVKEAPDDVARLEEVVNVLTVEIENKQQEAA